MQVQENKGMLPVGRKVVVRKHKLQPFDRKMLHLRQRLNRIQRNSDQNNRLWIQAYNNFKNYCTLAKVHKFITATHLVHYRIK